MNHSHLTIDEAQWKRIGRRRFTMLAVLLAVNLSLLVLGVNSGLSRASVALSAAPAKDGQSQTSATEFPSATIHQETNGEQEPPVTTLPEANTASNATTAVAIATVPQSQVTQDPAAPANENQSAPPIATTPRTNDESGASQPAGADSSKPSANAPIAADAFEPTAVEETSPSLTIINPPATRGIIHYTIDGNVQTLSPGEYHRLEAGQERQIEFHQGDDLGYTERVLSTGFFVFRVGEGGWELIQSANAAGRRLLRSCRLVEMRDEQP